MKRAFLIFSLVLMTALAGCSDDDNGNGGNTGGDGTGGNTGGSAATVFNLVA